MTDDVSDFPGCLDRVAASPPEDNERRDYAPTDLGNARRLVDGYGDMLRYVPAWDRWLLWWHAGDRVGHWSEDRTGTVMRMAKEVARGIVTEAVARDDAKLGKWGFETQREPRLRAMIALARTEPEIVAVPEQFDVDPMLLNLRNGTLELGAKPRLRSHDRAQYLTKIAPIDHDPAATCPTWEAFLDRIFAGDAELIAFVQRAVGYSLTGRTDEQCLFLLHGSGANGKSTFVDALRHVLGDYATVTDFSTFLDQRREGARNDLARLRGARFVSAIEAEQGGRLAESLVKTLTGQDRIVARFLYREFFEYRPAFKIWLAANHKPRIRGTEHAIWRRIRLIPFLVTIPLEERDGELPDTLVAESAGILCWAVEGCAQWAVDGLGGASAVETATEAYREEMDALGGFLEAHCTVAPNARGLSREVYRAYAHFTEDSGERPMSSRAFVQAMQERGFEKRRSGPGGTREWYGIALRTDVLPSTDTSYTKPPHVRAYGELGETDVSTRQSVSEAEEERLAMEAEGQDSAV